MVASPEDTLRYHGLSSNLRLLFFVVRFCGQCNFLDTGIGSNHWTSLFILVGSENFYPVLNDTFVVPGGLPDNSPKATSKNNLELSGTHGRLKSVRFSTY